MNERVNHPPHYTAGGIECIDALEAATAGLEGIEAVCTANAIKYLWRWKRKGGVEDLQKAVWYIEKLIGIAGQTAQQMKGAIQMEKTMTTGKLDNLATGSRFTYGGVEWVILGRAPRAALCLAADVLEERAFDDENKNDFAASSLRAYLNGEFMKKLVEAGASEDAFGSMVLDLTADDGLENYGQDRAKIGLLTCEMYRHFRSEIPEIQKWWWLATADSPRNNYARLVIADGSLDYGGAYYGSGGVRPLCVLKSEILVSYDEAQIKKHEVSPFEKILEAAAKKAFEDLERRIVGGDGANEPKGILSALIGNQQIKADKIKVEAAEGDEPHKRAEAVDMMKHIAAAFGIPATIDEEPEEEGHAEYANELHGVYAALLEAGFTEPQAWEIFMHNVRSAQ